MREVIKIFGVSLSINYLHLLLRCPFVTIDPVTTEKDVEREPLKTLRTYRKLESAGRKTVMGIHLGIRVRGKIALGDSVFVDDG